ncbi:UDP-galactopyranose mutase [Methanobacterium sp.]|uniref:UDP-galactopyranose mutase n=1 Tax=Methanobacterium sp. TaxID=2164 RepID=UPI003C76EBD8
MIFDYVVIGAGFAGSVIAERIANTLNKKVLIIEKRNHIGGNCFDYYDKNGILVHKYGPHIFHTQMKHVWNYISQFTEWYTYTHYVLGYIDNKYVPIPFNLNTLEQLLPKEKADYLKEKLIQNFSENVKIPILELRKTDDKDLQVLADFIYQKVFLNYTRKQWGMEPEELDSSVTARVPVYISRDNRYFQDKYQGMPKNGYTNLFERMLSNKNIEIMLETDFKDIIKINYDKKKIYFNKNEFKGKLIYTGEIDAFFEYKFGKLPYRSLKFNFETKNKDYFQEVGTINYPNDYKFTRITEFKHLTGQKNVKTTIIKEYPQKYNKDKDIPYYPIPQRENLELYEKYRKEAENYKNVFFVGRLAEYQYYNMDIVIDKSLQIFKEKIANE